MLYGLQERNSKAKTWVYHVKRLLCVNGFGYVWMYREVGDERRFLHIFNKRQCERYLGCMQSKIYKTALARFRFRVSRINCHRLRFSAAFDLRTCSFGTTSTDDECHMLPYTDLTTKFSFETTANVNTLLNLSKFLFFLDQAQRKLDHRMK